MKHVTASCVALLLLVCACPAPAQVYGQFGPATPVAVDHRLFGLYGDFSSHQSSLLAQLRLSFYPGLDFGFQGGVSHVTSSGTTRTVVQLGGDFKTLVAHRSATFPVDLSLGGALGVGSADNYNLLSLGPQAVASATYTLRGGAELSPYGGLALLYVRSDIASASNTDMSLQLRAGLEARLNPDLRLVLELQAPMSDPTDSHPKLVLGANFPF